MLMVMMKIALINNLSYGNGVGATEEIKANEMVLKFSGYFVNSKNKLKQEDLEQDHYLQLASNLYLGSSGNIDDYVNHSCDPNCTVMIKDNEAFLIASKIINPGEEITFDYSDVVLDDDWSMECNCGSQKCRKIIKAKNIV